MAIRTRKTTLDVDIELLARAQEALGTSGLKETIDRALTEVVIIDARRRTIARLVNAEPINPDELRRETWGES